MEQLADLFTNTCPQSTFFSFLSLLPGSGAVQYLVWQGKEMFCPRYLPQGLGFGRADNGNHATEFPVLETNSHESFIGSALKIPTDCNRNSRIFKFHHNFIGLTCLKNEKNKFSFHSRAHWNAAADIPSPMIFLCAAREVLFVLPAGFTSSSLAWEHKFCVGSWVLIPALLAVAVPRAPGWPFLLQGCSCLLDTTGKDGLGHSRIFFAEEL